MTIIWSTAYLEEAERCPHVIMLDAGHTLYVGPPAALTQQAQGRVYHVRPTPPENTKQLLDYCVRHSAESAQAPSPTLSIDDALIQGSTVRLVLHDAVPQPTLKDAMGARHIMPVTPRLEDAYMRILGGINHTPSPFAAGGQVLPTPAPLRIEAQGLARHFGDFVAAHNISFRVRAGEIFGLLGPNGAGKSTTFRMLCGLLRPTAGQCFVDGVDLLKASSKARARLGYMAQKFSLYPDIRVQENIAIYADLYGLSSMQKKERVPLLLHALDLEPYVRHSTKDLPLGQKQRLALLCATLHNPPVLFLDEPTSGVDTRTRRDFWKHITAMTRAGTAVLVTTHFMEEAEYCDHIALIYQGSIISSGTPDMLKANAPYPHTEKSGDVGHSLEEAFIAYIEHYHKEDTA